MSEYEEDNEDAAAEKNCIRTMLVLDRDDLKTLITAFNEALGIWLTEYPMMKTWVNTVICANLDDEPEYDMLIDHLLARWDSCELRNEPETLIAVHCVKRLLCAYRRDVEERKMRSVTAHVWDCFQIRYHQTVQQISLRACTWEWKVAFFCAFASVGSIIMTRRL